MKQQAEIFCRRAVFSLTVAVGLCVAAPSGHGSVVRALNLDQLIGLSDLVVEGRVGIGHQSNDSPRGRPQTDTTIQIVEVLHGEPILDGGGVLQIRQIRGLVDGKLVSVVGDPVLKLGDHVILMLRHVAGRYYLTALAQSVFWIHSSVTPPRIEQRLGGLMRVTELGGGSVRAADAPVPTLAQLRKTIRSAEAGR